MDPNRESVVPGIDCAKAGHRLRMLLDPIARLLLRLAYGATPAWALCRGSTRFGAAVAVWPDSEILLVRHPYRPGFGLPRDRLRMGESLGEAAARELSDEVGIDVNPGKLTLAPAPAPAKRGSPHAFEFCPAQRPILSIEGREIVKAMFCEEKADAPTPKPAPMPEDATKRGDGMTRKRTVRGRRLTSVSCGLVLASALALAGLQPARADVRVWTDKEERILKGTLQGIEVLPTKPPAPATGPDNGAAPETPRSQSKPSVTRNARIMHIATAAELLRSVAQAEPGDTIVLAPGTYRISRKRLAVTRPGTRKRPITLRAEMRGQAVIELNSVEGFYVDAPNWVFENLDIRGVCASHSKCEHAFHIVGRADRTVIRNNQLVNFNAAIKGNGKVVAGKRVFPNDVLIAGNRIFNTEPRETNNPVTPIDVVGGRGWVVRGNFIADFEKRRGNRISYAAFLKGNSMNGVFERNLVVCEWRHRGGIRLGLSFGGGGSGGKSRLCEEGDCSREHRGGIMRNNIIVNCPVDVGIYLNRAANTKVYNNTLYKTEGIDVRFETSTADIRNNILSGRIRDRNGGRHTAASNLVGVQKSEFRLWFKAPEKMDFTLKLDRYVVNKAELLPGITYDFCGTRRVDGSPDIGAIEYVGLAGCDIAVRFPGQ